MKDRDRQQGKNEVKVEIWKQQKSEKVSERERTKKRNDERRHVW